MTRFAGIASAVRGVAADGNNHWSGRFPVPNTYADDGPFATLARSGHQAD